MGASSLESVINYSNEANFAFDADDVEFVGSLARLKLQEGTQNFSQTFDNDTGFTYDSSLAEFASGLVRQLDKTPANSVFAGKMVTKDLNWHKSGGSITGTLNGSPTFGTGKMVCTGSQGVYYSYTTSTIETHKFKYTPSYTGGPATNGNVIGNYNGTNNNDRWYVMIDTAGTLRYALWNSSGVVVKTLTSMISLGAVSGTEKEIEVVIDSVTGVFRIFVAGVMVANSPGAWTRGGVSSRVYLGASPSVYNQAEASYDDYIMYTNAQHTASYTPGYTLNDTIYLESKIDLPVFSFIGLGSITTVDSAIVNETGAPRYIVAGRYWSGSAWVVSDGSFAQASNSSDTISNLPDFPAAGGTAVPVSVVFGDTNTQQSIDDFSVTVTGTIDYPTTNPTIIPNASISELDALESFKETTSDVTAPDAIRYILVINGQDKYWDGSAWENSDGTYAQANDAVTIDTNKAALDLSLGASLKAKAFLHSEDGSTTPTLTTITIGYNFFNSQLEPATCTVWGFYRDVSGKPVEGATVSFKLQRASKQYREAGDAVIEKPLSVLTDSSGRFELDLIRSSEYEADGDYEITIVKEAEDLDTSYIDVNETNISFTVPDQSSVNVTDLITALA